MTDWAAELAQPQTDWAAELAKPPTASPEPTPEPKPTQPDGSALFPIAGLPEAAASVVSGTAAKIASGYVGLAGAILPGPPGQGADWARQEQDQRTFLPRTAAGKSTLRDIGTVMSPLGNALDAAGQRLQQGFNYLGAPVAGAIARGVPEAATYALPAARGLRAPEALAPVRAPMRPPVAPPELPAVPETSVDAQTSMLKDAAKQRALPVAAAVNPDPAVLAAAERAKIDLNPSHVSQNVSYMELEQKLKADPKSKLAAQEIKAIGQIGDRADQLVTDLGGATDRTIFDHKLRTDLETNITALESKSNALYRKVNDAIPPTAQVSADASRAYIKQKLDELGGRKELLDGPESELLTLLGDGKGLTYAALDRLRRKVGQGFKQQGVYKDSDSHILGEVYGALSEDQMSVASALGQGDMLATAQKLIASRKALETQSQAIFGRDLQRTAIPQVRAAATNLPKGDTAAFTKLLDSVPKHLRRDAATAVLNDIFTLGSRNNASVGGGFATAWNGLTRNKGALTALQKELPADAVQRLDDLGLISSRLYRAKALENTSGTAKTLLANLDAPGIMAKIYGFAPQALTAEGISSSVGLPGVGTAIATARSIVKQRTPATVVADEFLHSAALKKAINVIAENPQAASKVVEESPAFKKWLGTRQDAAQILKMGFIPWLAVEQVPPQQVTGNE